MEFSPLPVPNLGYDYQKPKLAYFRVWHSATQKNPEEFVTEEVATKIVKAKTGKDAMRKVQNTYKHHVLKVEEVTDAAELADIKRRLYEKKLEEEVV